MIFITGATGFVGKNLLPLLLREGFNLECLVKENYENIEFWKKCDIGIIEGDLAKKEYLHKLPQKTGTVIHMAATIHSKDKKEFYKINFEGTKNLVDECSRRKVKHFIFLSSLNVLHENPDDYAKSKKMTEKYLKQSGLNYTILRPSLIYGKGNTKNIGQFVKMVKKWPIVPITGSGKNKIQPVYVKDVVNVINIILKNPEKFYNKIYNLVGPDTISINDLINLISDTLKVKRRKIHLPLSLMNSLAGLYEKISSNPKFTKSQITNSTREFLVPCDWSNDFGITPTSIKDGIEETI